MQQIQVPDLVVVSGPTLSLIVEDALRKVLSQEGRSQSNADEFLTVDQAAQYLQMSVSSLYTHTSQRKIPHLKRARRLFFRRIDLDGWLLDGRRKTRDEIAQEVGINRKLGQR